MFDVCGYTLGRVVYLYMQPFYDPEKSYEDNFKDGPFGAFSELDVFKNAGKPTYELFGNKLFLPFGIPAGPLVNGTYVKAALDKGFDIPVYKTVRTKKYPCHAWPNVLAVHPEGDLTLEQAENGLVADAHYTEPLSITNSFGVPSFDPDFWQKDLANAVSYAKEGQVVVGSFQGTAHGGSVDAYIQDFVDAARLVKETGAKILTANLSCPNEGTAHLLCFDIERAQKVVDAIKNEIGNTPLLIKAAYFKENDALEKFVKQVASLADGITAINTIPSEIKNAQGEQALPGKGRAYSGVCGASIKWAGLSMVRRLAALREKLGMDFRIVGSGGVMNFADYAEYREAGANAVLSATGAMWNPLLAQEIKKEARVAR